MARKSSSCFPFAAHELRILSDENSSKICAGCLPKVLKKNRLLYAVEKKCTEMILLRYASSINLYLLYILYYIIYLNFISIDVFANF